jgi:hypothetical protein
MKMKTKILKSLILINPIQKAKMIKLKKAIQLQQKTILQIAGRNKNKSKFKNKLQ